MSTPFALQAFRVSLCMTVSLSIGATASGQSPDEAMTLELRAGRSMRVALDHRVTIHTAGQAVTGTLVEAVYVYDRIVLPIGTRLTGHIERLEQPSKARRTLAMIGGDFSSHATPILTFDSIVNDEGQVTPVTTLVRGGTLRARRQVAGNQDKPATEDDRSGAVQHARDAISEKAHEALALLTDPGKVERFEEMAIGQLPYHPAFLLKGMVYDVELVAPVTFGSVVPVDAAPAGSTPVPDSILTAKLSTTIDSAKTPRGTPLTAVLTQPVFSADHHLIFPEGTVLSGEVTYARPARRWRRNGNLRILFTAVQPPAVASRPLLASLYSVEAGAGDRVAVDEEGGMRITNSKTRFIPPALALLALRGSAHQDQELDDDDVGRPAHMVTTQSPGAQALGGFFGFGALGAVVSQFSHPVAIVVSSIGAARTVYAGIFAKGREVVFSGDTPIQVRLAPGAPANK